jgi:hypothetical protein
LWKFKALESSKLDIRAGMSNIEEYGYENYILGYKLADKVSIGRGCAGYLYIDFTHELRAAHENIPVLCRHNGWESDPKCFSFMRGDGIVKLIAPFGWNILNKNRKNVDAAITSVFGDKKLRENYVTYVHDIDYVVSFYRRQGVKKGLVAEFGLKLEKEYEGLREYMIKLNGKCKRENLIDGSEFSIQIFPYKGIERVRALAGQK